MDPSLSSGVYFRTGPDCYSHLRLWTEDVASHPGINTVQHYPTHRHRAACSVIIFTFLIFRDVRTVIVVHHSQQRSDGQNGDHSAPHPCSLLVLPRVTLLLSNLSSCSHQGTGVTLRIVSRSPFTHLKTLRRERPPTQGILPKVSPGLSPPVTSAGART